MVFKSLKPLGGLILKLILLLGLIKCIFFIYNYSVGKGWQITGLQNTLKIIGWGFYYDLLLILILLLLPVIILFFIKKKNAVTKIISLIFSLPLAFLYSINLADVFYYPFKLQRSDAELLFVLRNPFENINNGYFYYFLLSLIGFALFTFISYRWLIKYSQKQVTTNFKALPVAVLAFLFIVYFICGSKLFIPTYPLVDLPFYQLPLAQNSLHTFAYSLFRKKSSTIFSNKFLKSGKQTVDKLIKKNTTVSAKKKNIVLFIMESVPFDFFDAESKYKAQLPFFDSLLTKSTFFNNCFSYSHNSNKGITAILSGAPTLTEIPLYHSGFTGIPITHTGTVLANQGYQSSFFIGDNYDDFGFAKAVGWLGIEHYYCKSDVPNYKQLPQHTMGLHDQYVLGFMQAKLANMEQPFFAVNFNISTHIPNDLPEEYEKNHPSSAATKQMKSTEYYDWCLQNFFAEAKHKDWFKESVFIFISDHWMYPDLNNPVDGIVQNFRIPLIIYDPQNPIAAKIETPVSQLDIVNTLLYYGAYKNEYISYGTNLTTVPTNANRTVFAKENNIIYQAFDSSYVLGFNTVSGLPEYFYNYKNDKDQKLNLIHQSENPSLQRLSAEMKTFLRTAYRQYQFKKVY